MAIKKSVKKKVIKNRKSKKNIHSEFEKQLDEAGKEIKHIERWMIERRKFFIKLGIVSILIIILLIISHLYLRVVSG